MLLSSYLACRDRLVQWFVLLGPLGSLITPSFLPKPFRFYYFLLPLFPLLFLRIQKQSLQICWVFAPFFLYCFASAAITQALGAAKEEDQIFRFLLFFSHFYFVVGASSTIFDVEKIKALLISYIYSFLSVLLIGYIFFFGYYCGWFSLAFLERFSILTQFGYGFLRFCPGSYPNEFGTVSSFVLSVLICMICKEPSLWVKRPFFYGIFLLLTFGALLLATTRSAYLSFAVSFLYLCYVFRNKAICWFILFFLALFSLAHYVQFPLFPVVFRSFLQRLDEGSLGERYFAWLDAWQIFQDHYFWGLGFGSFPQLHNVYLSFFFELGVLGCLVLLYVFGLARFLGIIGISKSSRDGLIDTVTILGLIHVFGFAASNHNLNHHLTWFVAFLYFSSLRIGSEVRGVPYVAK